MTVPSSARIWVVTGGWYCTAASIGGSRSRKSRSTSMSTPPDPTMTTGPNTGSIFRNPPGDFAGRLIEAAGLKGKTIGRMRFSPKHAIGPGSRSSPKS